jgi:hypothetical protein
VLNGEDALSVAEGFTFGPFGIVIVFHFGTEVGVLGATLWDGLSHQEKAGVVAVGL